MFLGNLVRSIIEIDTFINLFGMKLIHFQLTFITFENIILFYFLLRIVIVYNIYEINSI